MTHNTLDPKAAKQDILDSIDRDRVEAEVWWRPGLDRDGHLVPDDFSYISCEIIPADSTRVLNDVLKEHGLVLRDVSLGAEGFRATLTYEGMVHSEGPTDEVAELHDVEPDDADTDRIELLAGPVGAARGEEDSA